jgi:glycosyltransferase involved in cell wall biosynthesis
MRLAYFVSHPIQYQAPLLRHIAADPDIKLKVFFYSDFSLNAYTDPGFGRVIEWDVPLTEGYDYEFLDCVGSKKYENALRQPIAINIVDRLKVGKFDAVWVHGWNWVCSIQAILAAKQLGIPVLLRGESNGLTEPSHPVKQKVKASFLKWLFEKIDYFLYIGTLNFNFYRQYGIPEKQLISFPYAVDNDHFQKKAAQARLQQEHFRQTLQLEAGKPIILYAAKLIDLKRPQDLLAAYRLLSINGRQEPEPYLLFVGDGVLRPQLEAMARETGWRSIRFLGFRNQSEMPAMYDLCDVFVLPSRFEPWGLAINEVMNAGKAVVVSNQVGCGPDLMKSDNGRSFPVGNIAALTESILWALSNSKSAGAASLNRIQDWSFAADLIGLKQALKLSSLPIASTYLE